MRRFLVLALLVLATAPKANAQGNPVDYTSKAPRYSFGDSRLEQERQLKDNPLMRRFRELRLKRQNDRHAPRYHFSSPEARLNDPNGLCYWQGRWHLFYQAQPPEDRRWHWAHAVSDDLVHWHDLPFAIFPNPEEQSYSGSILVEADRVIAMYHGRNLGTMAAGPRKRLGSM